MILLFIPLKLYALFDFPNLSVVNIAPLLIPLFPFPELAPGRAFVRYAMALVAAAAIECVETEPAPTVVGVIGVGGKLQKNRGRFSRLGRSQNKEATALRSPRVHLNEFSTAITRPQRHMIIAAAPRVWDFHCHRRWPPAAVRGGIFRNRMFAACD